MQQAMANQPHSAQRVAAEAGIRHGDRVTAEVVVGVTPAGMRSGAVVAHFCSSRMGVHRVKTAGNGPIPDTPVVFPNGLPTVAVPSFLRMEATIVSNGSLSFRGPRNARVVRIPDRCLDQVPWAWDGGAEFVADELGCTTVDEMFEQHGELVS